MKELYIVRHGESESNAERIFQDGDSHLSEKGQEQAKFLAQRVAKLPNIDLIVCSPYVRTRETLDEILKVKEHKVVFTELAQEIERPSELIGKAIDSEEALIITDQIDANKADPNWHYSDEENFTDFKNRAIKLIQYLESFEEKTILLIAHGLLLKMMEGVMLYGENLTAEEHTSINSHFKTKNTGITKYSRSKDSWHLETWMDVSHLG